jgi:predicted transcriptional regulator
MNAPTDRSFLPATAQIVASHVAHHALSADRLPDLIRDVYKALSGAEASKQPGSDRSQIPAVPIKNSVFPDYIVCLEDGKQLKTLKRHLMASFKMTPDEYRKKWGLPFDYPMTAPNYAETRSQLAKQLGLGRGSKGRRWEAPKARPVEPPQARPVEAQRKNQPAESQVFEPGLRAARAQSALALWKGGSSASPAPEPASAGPSGPSVRRIPEGVSGVSGIKRGRGRPRKYPRMA